MINPLVGTSKAEKFLYIGITIAVVFLLYKILSGISGLFGGNDDESKNADYTTKGLPTLSEQNAVMLKRIAKEQGTTVSKLDPARVLKAVENQKITSGLNDTIKSIYDAKSFLGDSEETVFGIFRNLKNKYQLAQLNSAFLAVQGKDLAGYLATFMDTLELQTAYKILAKLPEFTTINKKIPY